MISRVIFASCYVYSPSGEGATCERSRLLRALLKDGDARFLFKYAVRVRQQVAENSPLNGFLCPADVLVPIPGRAPEDAGGESVSEHLAKALVAAGLGRDVWSGLRRVHRVRKSATVAPGSRPTVANHYDSFAIATAPTTPCHLVLVDDVVTKGRTLLAAAARLHDAFPSADIRAFALLRTMGFVVGVDRLLDPCVGEIRWRAGDAHRIP